MKNTEHIVRAAIGHSGLKAIRRDESKAAQAAFFDVYRVQLPLPDFSGLPNEWVFAVQNQSLSRPDGIERQHLLQDGYTLLGKLPHDDRVVLVSDDPAAHLSDEFDNLQRDVFCLDALEFSTEHPPEASPRLAPFLGAVRRRVNSDPVFALMLSPYQRAKPVWGWRFFGRRSQLGQLITTNENFVIVGARRVGKTSLMREAYRRLRENGEQAFFVDVQNCETASDVVKEILHEISPRELARSLKHHEVFGETVFSNLLRRMSAERRRTTIFLDELGNVIVNLPRDNWSFLGILRKYSQAGQVRFVVSCFQEYFLRQQQEFTGPLINFATTMRLRVFTRREADEFVLAPLRFWRNLVDREERALMDTVVSRVGTHPFLLQYFCFFFLQRVAELQGDGSDPNRRSVELAHEANALFNAGLTESFEAAIDELFIKIPSPLAQYLFLRRCREADVANERLDQVELTEAWLDIALRDLRLAGTYQSYRSVLEALEMYSLCTSLTDVQSRMIVAAPIVYYYMQRTVPSIDEVIRRLAPDAASDGSRYGLRLL